MVLRSSGWILVLGLVLAAGSSVAADKKKGQEQEFSVEDLCRKNFQTGQEYLKNQRYLDAKESFTLVVEACPEDADAHRQLGLTCLTMREYALAAESFEKARALRPDDPDLKVNLAIAYSYLARNDQTMADKALSLYLEVLESDPTRAAVFQNVGQIYAGQGKMPESIMMNMQALTLSGDTAEVELPEPQGRDWLTAKVFPQAYTFFKNRTERDTTDLGSLRILAYFYYRTKLWNPAIQAYETILAREPESATAFNEHKILSDALKKAGSPAPRVCDRERAGCDEQLLQPLRLLQGQGRLRPGGCHCRQGAGAKFQLGLSLVREGGGEGSPGQGPPGREGLCRGDRPLRGSEGILLPSGRRLPVRRQRRQTG